MMVPSEGKWLCKRCGKVRSPDGSEEKIITEAREDQGMLVIDGNMDTLPKTKARCEKCGHNEAYWVIRQTRAADEPETRIYRCVKCSHSWREY
jgi:DNA-directed RNA polymerase subunit M